LTGSSIRQSLIATDYRPGRLFCKCFCSVGDQCRAVDVMVDGRIAQNPKFRPKQKDGCHQLRPSAAYDADARLGVVIAAGMADRLLYDALRPTVTSLHEIPKRFFHRRLRAVKVGVISQSIGETLTRAAICSHFGLRTSVTGNPQTQ